VASVNDIVFWHQQGRNRTLELRIAIVKMVLRLPRDVPYWLNKGRSHLCRSNSITSRANWIDHVSLLPAGHFRLSDRPPFSAPSRISFFLCNHLTGIVRNGKPSKRIQYL
jgi:hypothetical protein